MSYDTSGLYFIPGSLENTDKYIEVADGHDITAKQKWQVQIKIYDNNGDTYIVKFHNVILALDLFNRLFLIITLMNSGHNCLFYKSFLCDVLFWQGEKCDYFTTYCTAETCILGRNKGNFKIKEIAPKKKLLWNYYTID